jgi:hypothetical protein
VEGGAGGVDILVVVVVIIVSSFKEVGWVQSLFALGHSCMVKEAIWSDKGMVTDGN